MNAQPEGIPARLRYWARLSRDTELRREALRAAHLIEVQGRAIAELREKATTSRADALREAAASLDDEPYQKLMRGYAARWLRIRAEAEASK